MTGTTTKKRLKSGKVSWGYSYFAGWVEQTAGGYGISGPKAGLKQSAKRSRMRCANAIEEHKRTPAAERTVPTFSEFFERYHRECISRECSPKTVERTQELAQYAIRLFGAASLDQLTTEQLTTDMNRLLDHGGRVTKQHPKGRPLAPKTVRHIAFLVQACLAKALDWEIIAKNPMLKVRKPKVPKRRPKVIDRGGFDTLLDRTAGMSVYPVIVVGASTGMRRGEMLRSNGATSTGITATLEVSKSLEETKQGLRIKSTKSGETRRSPYLPKCSKCCAEHKREQDHQRELYGDSYANLNLIFCRPDGQCITLRQARHARPRGDARKPAFPAYRCIQPAALPRQRTALEPGRTHYRGGGAPRPRESPTSRSRSIRTPCRRTTPRPRNYGTRPSET